MRCARLAWLLFLPGCLPPAASAPGPELPVRRVARGAQGVIAASGGEAPGPAAEPARAEPRRPKPDGLLCGPGRHAQFLRLWPAGREVERIRDRGLIFYTEAEAPRVYQVMDEGRAILARADTNTSANNEFPWQEPAGVPRGSNVKTVKFVQLDEPVQWWRSIRSDGSFARFRWEFPEGTRFGELLLVTDSRGYDHAFELRTRVKRPAGKGWGVQVYRPFPTEDDFAEAFGRRSQLLPRRLIDSGHDRNAFSVAASGALLPRLDEDQVLARLDGAEFVPVKGQQWLPGVEAPTADQFSIVPVGYFASHVPVDNRQCARCHQDAGRVVNRTGERRWRLRGDDGIFSFPIFDGDRLRLNPRLAAAGLLAHAEGRP